MSPLQYQKQLRLQQARGRMLVDGLDSTSAAFEVGYESVSQFNRGYSRFFGQPPMRDIKTLLSAEAPPSELVVTGEHRRHVKASGDLAVPLGSVQPAQSPGLGLPKHEPEQPPVWNDQLNQHQHAADAVCAEVLLLSN